MTYRKCVVPNCRYKQIGNGINRRSVFRCPKDEKKARRWSENIPGIDILLPNQYVCEIHFEPQYKTKYTEVNSPTGRTRLQANAVPTLFYGCDTSTQPNQTALFNQSINFVPETFGPMNPELYIQPTHAKEQIQSTSTETRLGDVLKALSDSEKVLMEIKQEETICEIKMENLAVKIDMEPDMELTVFDQLRSNFNHYITQLPQFWNLAQLSLGSEEVYAFSKECTVKEDNSLVVMYEKSIVLSKNGSLLYSVHGKTLKIDETYTPSKVTNVEELFNIILKFDDLKVCQGICTVEFEVDKDCIIYKDDLGLSRHVNCVLITDAQQCNPCYEYSMYLSSIVINNTPVLSEETVCFYDQIY